MTSLRHRKHCFPLTCLSFMFHLLFFSFLLHIRRRRPDHYFTRYACCCILSLIGIYRTRARLAAASFFERTDPFRALIIRNDGIPLCCCCYRIHCRSSLTRTLAAASYHKRSIGRGTMLAAASYERTTDRTRGHACCWIILNTTDILI